MRRSEVARLLGAGGIENDRGEARILFADLATLPLPVWETDPDTSGAGIDEERMLALVRRRIAGEPLQYLLGICHFFGECYEVTPEVLIPRQDTELLVEWAVEHVPRGGHFLDLCTGSGCVAISVLAHRPDLSAEAVDLSPGALEVAARNAVRNGVSDRLTLTQADALTFRPTAPCDALLSNPPYIRRDVLPTLPPDVQREPRMALDGGEDGLTFYRAFVKNLPFYIYKEGFAALEIGYDQADALRSLAREGGYAVTVHRDLGQNDRLVTLTFGGAENAPD